MANDFTRQLANLRGSSLGTQGIMLGVRAKKMGEEEARIQELVSNLRDLNAMGDGTEPLTTEQQVNQANEELAPELGNITDQANMMMAQQEQMIRDRQRMSDLYTQTITELNTMITPEAAKVAQALGIEFSQKEKYMIEKQELAQKKLKYTSDLYNLESIKNDLELKKMALTRAKKDLGSLELLEKMVADGDVFSDKNLIFNQSSGALGYDPDAIFDKAQELYGEDPSYNGAALMLDELVRNKVRNFRPPAPNRGGSGNNALANNEIMALTKANWLKEQTAIIDRYQFDPNEQWLRDAYLENASEEQIKYYQSNPYKMFDNQQLIDQMSGGFAKSIAKDAYDIFFNPNSDKSYWKELDSFQTLVQQKNFALGRQITFPSSIQTGKNHTFFSTDFRLGGAPINMKFNNEINSTGFSSPGYKQVHQSQVVGQINKENWKKQEEASKSESRGEPATEEAIDERIIRR